VPVAPLKIERVAAHHFGLFDIQIGRNDLVRLQNAERIRRLGRGMPRFRARSARALPAQKFERIAAEVAVVPLDLQRAAIGFLYINRNHKTKFSKKITVRALWREFIIVLELHSARTAKFFISKMIGFLNETVYIIVNFALQIKHFY
jgi:hypothetical protein